jgi:hypothetical protein
MTLPVTQRANNQTGGIKAPPNFLTKLFNLFNLREKTMNVVPAPDILDHPRDIAISPDPNRPYQVILKGKDQHGNYKEEVIYVNNKVYISLFPYRAPHETTNPVNERCSYS